MPVPLLPHPHTMSLTHRPNPIATSSRQTAIIPTPLTHSLHIIGTSSLTRGHIVSIPLPHHSNHNAMPSPRHCILLPHHPNAMGSHHHPIHSHSIPTSSKPHYHIIPTTLPCHPHVIASHCHITPMPWPVIITLFIATASLPHPNPTATSFPPYCHVITFRVFV